MASFTAGTVSTRLVWPFARLMRDYGPELSVIRAAGLSDTCLADPSARLPYALANRLLRVSLRKTGNAALGLHAGERLEPGDLGMMEYAARSSPDLRSALNCCALYARLLDDDIEASLIEQGNRVIWRIRWSGGERVPAANDFAISASLSVARRLLGMEALSVTVRLQHPVSTDAAEYERVFRAPVVLGASANELVFPRAGLDIRLAHANRDLFGAFDSLARQMLQQLGGTERVSARARRLIRDRLPGGDANVSALARELRMSASTVKRRLAEEGTSHRALVADVRRELALAHLANRNLTVSEVGFLLGFSTVAAFSRAFRRWAGASPQDYRNRYGVAVAERETVDASGA